LAVAFSAAGDAHARVLACVIDGGAGGTGHRLCGISALTTDIRSAYPFSGNASQYVESDFSDSAKPAGSGYSSECWTDNNGMSESFTKANAASRVTTADATSVSAGCLAGAGGADVCDLWVANHGNSPMPGVPAAAQASYVTLYPSGAMDVNGLDKLASRCGTTRFASNSCFGAPLNLIFKKQADGTLKYVPGRCGVSGAPTYMPAHAFPSCFNANGPTSDAQIALRQQHPDQCKDTYPFAHSFSEGLAASAKSGKATQDAAYLHALFSDPTSDTPKETSDFYLDTRFPQQRLGAGARMSPVQYSEYLQIGMSTCADSKAGKLLKADTLPGPEVSEFFNQSISPALAHLDAGSPPVSSAEKDFIKTDLGSMEGQVRQSELDLCGTSPWKDGCASLGSDQAKIDFIQKKYAEYRAQRDALLTKMKQLNDAAQNPNAPDSVFDQLKQLKDQYNTLYYGEVNGNGGGQGGAVTVGNMWDRYEQIRNRLSNAVNLYESGNGTQIKEFVALRKCETSDYYKPSPR
jgi:hypothetical protein